MDSGNRKVPLQFSLQSLMLSFVVVASAVSAFSLYGFGIAAILLAIAVYIRSAKSKKQAFNRAIWILIFTTVFWILFIIDSQSVHKSSRRGQCANNLHQIGLALLDYESERGCFPPPYMRDKDGKLWQSSWRILIMPQLGRLDLYDAYNLIESSDGPTNSKLVQKMPQILQCPSDPSAIKQSTTNYVAVIGTDTLWPDDKPIGFKDIPDGADKTILLIEWPRSDINWLEPRDLTISRLLKELESNAKPNRFAVHTEDHGPLYLPETGVHVLFADGSVRLFSVDYLRKNMKAMLTRNGGETIEPFSRRINWPWLTAVIILIISTVVLVIRPKQWNNQTELHVETK
jgi:prepilin-type processing-associated H-X9-DG protein